MPFGHTKGQIKYQRLTEQYLQGNIKNLFYFPRQYYQEYFSSNTYEEKEEKIKKMCRSKYVIWIVNIWFY